MSSGIASLDLLAVQTPHARLDRQGALAALARRVPWAGQA